MSSRLRALAVAWALSLAACVVTGTLGGYPVTSTDADTTAAEPVTTGTTDAPADEAGPCADCIAERCLDGLLTCKKGSVCKCVLDCLKAGTDAGACVERCDVDAVVMQVLECAQAQCPDAC